MVSLNNGDNQAVGGLAGRGHLPGSARTRLAAELFNGRFRPRQSVELREIAVAYELDHESVLKVFREFQGLGMVTLSGNSSAIVRSRNPEETQEAYEIRAATEEIAGRTAATVLKGYTGELQNELAAMRTAVARGDLEACAEHDVKFHRDILKAAQNDVLLRVWDTLAFDLRIPAAMGTVSKGLPEVVESHRPIVDALEKGCGREAGLLLRNHVETVLECLTRAEADRESHRAPRGDLALFDDYAVERVSVRTYRGGLSPARLRRVTELVHAKIEDDLSLEEMAESAGLSTTHFSHMFRKSTGESPHQFVLRLRVERAKEMLRAVEARVLDVAVACGFKTQQHFARVFRRLCGASPTEYRREFLR
ncbi:MAG TPA: helix-turn-helix domain-containing protein [Candidatus Acidoferrum sp.]|nr:helix-turn-helix domain-containing protein [Candidatus Acidoferrum sp.]